jgi:chromate transporter
MAAISGAGAGGDAARPPAPAPAVPLRTVLREWGRIGIIGFGGPPAHIRLLRQLCVERNGWLDETEFEDAIAVCNLMPGPASTQLAIFCAWRLRGRAGALVGGAGFIVPGLIIILALSVLFVSTSPPLAVLGAGAGAGAAVPAVALAAGTSLAGPSWRNRPATPRWICYLAAGLVAAPTIGPWLVAVLLACGVVELAVQRLPRQRAPRQQPPRRDTPERESQAERESSAEPEGPAEREGPPGREASPGDDGSGTLRGLAAAPLALTWAVGGSVLASVAWVAIKVGGLSFGGGFVIIPLMQSDAVNRYHWMTGAQFLNAVALGQVTPGPVVQTVAVVGYAAAGIAGGLLASAVAFAPSFAFVLLGARHFDRIRGDARARAFLQGSGPAAIGAIFGSAIELTREISHPWQYLVLAGALVLLFPLRRGVVLTLLSAAAVGVTVALAAGTINPLGLRLKVTMMTARPAPPQHAGLTASAGLPDRRPVRRVGVPGVALLVGGGDAERRHVVVGFADHRQAGRHAVAGAARRDAQHRAAAGYVERDRHHHVHPAAVLASLGDVAVVPFGGQRRDRHRRTDQRVVLLEQLTERPVQRRLELEPLVVVLLGDLVALLDECPRVRGELVPALCVQRADRRAEDHPEVNPGRADDVRQLPRQRHLGDHGARVTQPFRRREGVRGDLRVDVEAAEVGAERDPQACHRFER